MSKSYMEWVATYKWKRDRKNQQKTFAKPSARKTTSKSKTRDLLVLEAKQPIRDERAVTKQTQDARLSMQDLNERHHRVRTGPGWFV